MPEDGVELREKSEFMSNEEVIQMAQTFVQLGVKKIRLTGGEPLIRKSAHDIIRELGKLNVELAITTNGILVEKFIDTFRSAGITSVNVSLDSLKPDRLAAICRKDYSDRIYRNIQLLLNEGFLVKLNMVVMAGVNSDELVDFVELSKDKPLHVRFIEFMPFNGNDWNLSKGTSYQEMMQVISAHYGAENLINMPEKENDTARCYAIDGFEGTFGVIGSVTHPFCSSCNRIRVTADGKMKNCLFSTSETDLLAPLRNGEDISQLIGDSIQSKKAQRAGMNSLDDLLDRSKTDANRSMVSIGG
jgi:cyclic pyranopterin phosphate synthase